jgi:hypothetical protein
MANAKRDTSAIIAGFGGTEVWSPETLHEAHVRASQPWGNGQKLLIAILDTPSGHYLKELSDNRALQSVRKGPYAAQYFEISEEVLVKLKEHPRKSEIFG